MIAIVGDGSGMTSFQSIQANVGRCNEDARILQSQQDYVLILTPVEAGGLDGATVVAVPSSDVEIPSCEAAVK